VSVVVPFFMPVSFNFYFLSLWKYWLSQFLVSQITIVAGVEVGLDAVVRDDFLPLERSGTSLSALKERELLKTSRAAMYLHSLDTL
jgi:hypothetical protein